MTSPAEQEFWPELLERLAEESVVALAEAYQLEVAEIDAALAATTGERPVQQEAWWPEVLRDHEQGSLRQLARRFGTNPRRLRRGLARAAVRVAGSTVQDDGVEVLEDFRDRLGKEPDRSLAAEAGVTVEAIKGERRRLGIDPYRMKPDVEEWGGRPPGKRDKPRQRRRWQEAPEPVIIRRAGHGGGAEATVEPEPSVERRPRVPSSFRRVTLEAPVQPEEGDAVEQLSAEAAPPRADAKRRRIVRPTTPEEAPALGRVGAFGGLPRLGARSDRGSAEPELPVPELPEPAPPQPAPVVTAPAPVDREPPPRRARKKPSKTAASPSSPPSEPEPARARAAPPAPREPESPPVGTEPTAPPEPGSFAWHVQLPGEPEPMLVLADDMQAALSLAAVHKGVDRLDGAKAWRLAEVLHDSER
jgi:hypothetical protein